MIYIFGLVLIFIFLILVVQFESYIDLLVILLLVFLFLLGVFGVLWLVDLEVNVYSCIGLIMLIGLVIKNLILIVEFVNQLLVEGMFIIKVVIEVLWLWFCLILMIGFLIIFGVMFLVFVFGLGVVSWVFIGMLVMGGMLVFIVLILYVVFVFYVVMGKSLQFGLFCKYV